MWRPIRKVIGPPSLLQTTYSFAGRILCICVALSAKLEADNKALAKEKDARQATIRLFRLPKRRAPL
jgi:hypothetical protein